MLANQKTEKPIVHISINPDPKDKLSDEQLSEIAQTYMGEMGYGNQPFIVYKHADIERRYIHIVSLRVDETGKAIKDSFEHRRSMDVCRELEQKYGLVPADKKQRQDDTPLKAVRYEDGDIKHQIANVIRPIAKDYYFQSLKEYKALLSFYNVNVEEVRGEVKGKPYKGLVYSALNDKKEKVGHPFKSSLFGKSVGIEGLEKRIEKSTEIIKDKGLKERCKREITTAMRSCRDEGEFRTELGKKGIGVLFRTNDDGRIYGATFVDHEQKAVFNGSRLGKEFSANVFNDLFNGKQHEPIQTKHDSGQTFEPFDHSRKDEDSSIGSVFSLLSPEQNGTNPEEEAFARKARKKKWKGSRKL